MADGEYGENPFADMYLKPKPSFVVSKTSEIDNCKSLLKYL